MALLPVGTRREYSGIETLLVMTESAILPTFFLGSIVAIGGLQQESVASHTRV